jgi:hypothetical protein
MTTIKCSQFVKRQTKESGYSHFEGTWEELENLASQFINTGYCRQGYKPGVILINMPGVDKYGVPVLNRFRSATVKITDETRLRVSFAPRVEGEAPFIRIAAKNKKQPAAAVDLICYHADVLAEDDDRSTNADWEIIAIKARASLEEEPMDPYTMARNFLHLKGGTKGDFTAEQFAKSIVFWNDHCMSLSSTPWWKRIFKGK